MQNSPSDWLKLVNEAKIRKSVRSSFLAWATEILRDRNYAPAAHHRLLIQELHALTEGALDRLLILMPPGSAKSTYTSILFPPWWFAQHPNSTIITVSHTIRLAEHFSRKVRSTVRSREGQLGYSLARDERSIAQWRTSTGGEYVATGIRGAIAGRRADLIIIDDPIKSQADAESAIQRDNIWDWYRSDLVTRLRPHGRIVIVMTRWHEDDLGGRLLSETPGDWKLIRLPALAEDDDPLERPVGAPLWPEWESYEDLMRKRHVIGERVWQSLFQQRPVSAASAIFKVGHMRILDTLAGRHLGTTVRAWDLAATPSAPGKDPDWTVGLKLTRDLSEQFIISDVIRMRGSAREVEEIIITTARRDGRDVTIGLPEDPGQAGKSQVAYFVSRLAGYKVSASRETGSKFVRAMPLAAQLEAGNLTLLRGGWNDEFIQELKDFPLGRKDDQVDALSRAYYTMTRSGIPTRRINIPFLNR